MPWHLHPALRSLEKAEEAEGLIKSLSSVGYTVLSNEESSGKKASPAVPKGAGYFIRGNHYNHST